MRSNENWLKRTFRHLANQFMLGIFFFRRLMADQNHNILRSFSSLFRVTKNSKEWTWKKRHRNEWTLLLNGVHSKWTCQTDELKIKIYHLSLCSRGEWATKKKENFDWIPKHFLSLLRFIVINERIESLVDSVLPRLAHFFRRRLHLRQ